MGILWSSKFLSTLLNYFKKIVCNSPRMLSLSAGDKSSIYSLNLDLSTTLNWSQAALLLLPITLIPKRKGQDLILEVNGTTSTVRVPLLISSGETMIHGLGLRISAPTVGSGSNQ